MEIYLSNTLTGKKDLFEPIQIGQVSMYHCGPTVYNYPHIGNLRSYVLADILRRLFEYNDYKVKQVINITDVGHLTSDADDGEDKLESASKKENKSAHEIAEFYTKVFMSDLSSLNVETSGTIFPKASQHVAEQIELIKELERKGFTYKTTDGIYFDTSKFPRYGSLGNIDLSGLKEGARVETNSEKRNITDFALWKFSDTGEENIKRQQEWPSPWGIGFPGWHIECSAMSMKYLGQTFDIHTGGIDHIPVHHNNEIAQSEAANDKPLANYWLHNEHVIVPGGKMAKSAGNFVKLSDLIELGINPLAYKYWLLTAHYKSQVTYSIEAIKASQVAFDRLVSQVAKLPNDGKVIEVEKKIITTFLNDDLDTPKAIANIWDLLKSSYSPTDIKATILDIDKVLGLNLANVINEENEKIILERDIPQDIINLLSERQKAKFDKNWPEADRIRGEIEQHGYEIIDSNTGPILKKRY